MAILLAAPGRDTAPLVAAIAQIDPEVDLRVWPDLGDPQDIEFAVLWQHPRGLLATLPRLRAVSSLGAGVEHLLTDADLPSGLPVGRLAGARLAADMATYLIGQVLAHWRDFQHFTASQISHAWAPWAPDKIPLIGLLGTGQMGAAAARAFQALALPVEGWNHSGATAADIHIHTGQAGLLDLVERADYLLCLLPLTVETRGILGSNLFKVMKPDSVLINVARGQHLVEADLLEALARGAPGLAILDVFSEEPLPPQHPFWSHPRIRITPHCASITRDREAAELMLESYRRVQARAMPLGLVDRRLGY